MKSQNFSPTKGVKNKILLFFSNNVEYILLILKRNCNFVD